MKFDIIENFLPEYQCKSLEDTVLSSDFPWYFNSKLNVTEKNVIKPKTRNYLGNYYFYHYAYWRQNPNFPERGSATSRYLDAFIPILNKLSIPLDNVNRIKVNLYPRTNQLVHHLSHQDYTSKNQQRFGMRTALYYLNTNNGFTKFDGTFKRVKSKRNRIVLFDGSNPHHSTTTTNVNYRISVNYDYQT